MTVGLRRFVKLGFRPIDSDVCPNSKRLTAGGLIHQKMPGTEGESADATHTEQKYLAAFPARIAAGGSVLARCPKNLQLSRGFSFCGQGFREVSLP